VKLALLKPSAGRNVGSMVFGRIGGTGGGVGLIIESTTPGIFFHEYPVRFPCLTD